MPSENPFVDILNLVNNIKSYDSYKFDLDRRFSIEDFDIINKLIDNNLFTKKVDYANKISLREIINLLTGFLSKQVS